MTNIENYLSLARRTGFERVPVTFSMCPSLQEAFDRYVAETGFSFPYGEAYAPDSAIEWAPLEKTLPYYHGYAFKPGTTFDGWGLAHEPGSAAAFHMTKMYHPMESFTSAEEVLTYPFPVCRDEAGLAAQKAAVEKAHAQDLPVVGQMQCTIWELSWYLRGMENLMCDMMEEDPIATALLDKVTDISVARARNYAKAGVDVIFLGDDVGMQHTIMMSEGLYCDWLKPRLARVIREAKAINPDVIIFYHSCGHVTELVPHLIEAGIDVLDPVQPEAMDYRDLHERFGDRLSFHGTLGTQSVMPFGTPDDVRRTVFENLDIAGKHGGLFACPTHLLEPEVPVENVVAYIRACMDYQNR